MADKQVLRRVYLEKRLLLSRLELERRNKLVHQRVIEFLSLRQFNSLHTFLSIEKNNEVNTRSIIDALKPLNNNLSFYISKTMPKGKLTHYLWDESTLFEKNKWEIPEPVNATSIKPETIDVILVPLITFDKNGHRIGYGKGYYDRFLSDYPDALKIGVSLAPPLDNIPYVESTDVKLDRCVTPFQSYQF